MKSLSSQSRSRQGAGRAILDLLMDQPAGLLKDQQAVLARMAIESHPLVQTGALIGLLLAGDSESAWTVANQSQDSTISWLTAIALLRQSDVQDRERERVMMVLGRRDSAAVTRAASLTLASIRLEQSATFTLLSQQLSDPQLREASVRGMLMVGDQDRSPEAAQLAVRTITEFAESTAAELRTSDEFVDAMTLAEQLLSGCRRMKRLSIASDCGLFSSELCGLKLFMKKCDMTCPLSLWKPGDHCS